MFTDEPRVHDGELIPFPPCTELSLTRLVTQCPRHGLLCVFNQIVNRIATDSLQTENVHVDRVFEYTCKTLLSILQYIHSIIKQIVNNNALTLAPQKYSLVRFQQLNMR